MTPEQATDDIIELVYHSAVVSDDPWVQEVHTQVAVRDILEELQNSKSGFEEDFAIELAEAEREIDDPKDKLADLEEANAVLQRQLVAQELVIK